MGVQLASSSSLIMLMVMMILMSSKLMNMCFSYPTCQPTYPPHAVPIYEEDVDLLQFAENLEHLEADFFLWGALGFGLDEVAPQLVMGGPPPIGVQKANLDSLTHSIIYEFGFEEVGHLRALKSTVGGFPRPLMDLSAHNFAKLFDEAFGYQLRPAFDPYRDSLSYMLGSYVIPYMGLVGYVGANPLLNGYKSKRLDLEEEYDPSYNDEDEDEITQEDAWAVISAYFEEKEIVDKSADIEIRPESQHNPGHQADLAEMVLDIQMWIKEFEDNPHLYVLKPMKYVGIEVWKLKKNSVALDIVNFGEEDKGKAEKVEALLAAVNNNDSSHIVHLPATMKSSIVVRGGRRENISIYDIVVGDVIPLKIGDQVPTDGIIISGHSLAIDESSMTGESKIVTGVGINTEWGLLMLCSSNNELYSPSQALVRTHMVWKKDKKRIRRVRCTCYFPSHCRIGLLAGLLGVEAGQDAVIRMYLYERAEELVHPYNHTVAEFTIRISQLRNNLAMCGIKDEGIIVPPELGAENRTETNVLSSNFDSISYKRTPAEILRVLYDTGDEHKPGGFFPHGANGKIAGGFLKMPY
ncbi:unnamed protein product [Camellia sinensis]